MKKHLPLFLYQAQNFPSFFYKILLTFALCLIIDAILLDCFSQVIEMRILVHSSIAGRVIGKMCMCKITCF